MQERHWWNKSWADIKTLSNIIWCGFVTHKWDLAISSEMFTPPVHWFQLRTQFGFLTIFLHFSVFNISVVCHTDNIFVSFLCFYTKISKPLVVKRKSISLCFKANSALWACSSIPNELFWLHLLSFDKKTAKAEVCGTSCPYEHYTLCFHPTFWFMGMSLTSFEFGFVSRHIISILAHFENSDPESCQFCGEPKSTFQFPKRFIINSILVQNIHRFELFT